MARHLYTEKRSQVIVLSAFRNDELHLERGLDPSKASKMDINTNLCFKLQIIRTQLIPLKKFSIRFYWVDGKGELFQSFFVAVTLMRYEKLSVKVPRRLSEQTK